MNYKDIRLFLTASMLFVVGNVCSQEWISLDLSDCRDAVSAIKLKSDATEYLVKYTIHGIYDSAITNNHGVYHQLSLDNNGYSSIIGCPSLPIITQSIAIPEGAEISVSVDEESWSDISIGQIYPSQEPLFENDNTKVFIKDEESYMKEYLPQLVQISKEMEWRGVRNVRVAICPFKYYPTQNRLSVLCNFTLQVSFQHGKTPKKEKKVYAKEDIFHLFDNDIFVNNQKSDSIQQANNPPSYPNGKMLIVVGRNNSIEWLATCEKMQEFRKWKAFKGFDTFVVKLTSQNYTPEIIKEIITDYYYNHDVRYVLLVGDSDDDHIPMKTILSPYTGKGLRYINSDYWYGCLDGDDDYQAEVAVGRFPVRNHIDFCHMVDKTINYEKAHASSNSVLLVSHKQNASNEHIDSLSYQNCCNIIKNAYENDTVTFLTAYGANVSCGGDDATNADVLRHINDGVNIVNYRGHASSNFWGSIDEQEHNDTAWNNSDERFWSNQINNITSTDCSIYYCIACHTGNIIDPDGCMLETFTRAEKGATAFLGATTKSFTKPNHFYNIYLFDQLYKQGVYHIGDVNISAHLRNILFIDTLAKDNALCYLLGGDPTLEIWTDLPQQLDVDLQMANSEMMFNTSVNGSYWGALTLENGTHLQNVPYYSNSGTFVHPNTDFFFVVNRHNYYPHITYCNMTSHEILSSYDYDAYSFVTPLIIKEDPYAVSNETVVKVKNGNKLIIQNGFGGVTIQNYFECEHGAVLEIK